jgi:hypothetical protein
MEFDLEIDNLNKNQFATGRFNLYLIKEKNNDLTPQMYGNGLPTNPDGISIFINENTKSIYKGVDKRKVKAHEIKAVHVKSKRVTTKESKFSNLL